MNTNQNTLPALRGNLAELPLAPGKALEVRNIGNAYAVADLLVKTGFAPKGSTVETAVVAMIHGNRLGLDPLAAVQGIAVVNGRPTLWGDQLAAAVKGSSVYGGERVEYIGQGEDAGVRFTTWRKGHEDEPTVETFSVRDAKRAGLWGKTGPWTQYPRRMLFNRARAFAYRTAFPDALMGMRFREEEEDAAAQTAPAPVRPVPADEARPKSSKLRDALGIPPETPIEEATFAPGGDPAPENAPSAPQNVQEAAPPIDREEIPHLDD